MAGLLSFLFPRPDNRFLHIRFLQSGMFRFFLRASAINVLNSPIEGGVMDLSMTVSFSPMTTNCDRDFRLSSFRILYGITLCPLEGSFIIDTFSIYYLPVYIEVLCQQFACMPQITGIYLQKPRFYGMERGWNFTETKL
jgi:hypothetical protein